MSGHEWTNGEGDKCGLCGDKDYMADKFCSANPKFKKQYDNWIKEQKLENHNEATGCSGVKR